jgi:hypothetical protein
MSAPPVISTILYDYDTSDLNALFRSVILQDADPRVNACVILYGNCYLLLELTREVDAGEEIFLQRSCIDALPEEIQLRFEHY